MPVDGDQAKVQRILQNLLVNALKYTKRGGVTVRWEPVTDHQTDNWMFCLEDTGPGLDSNPEAAPLAHKIHASTQTAQAAEDAQPEDVTTADMGGCPAQSSQSDASPADGDHGEGVGLSMVKRLCELLDSSLELETSPGKGSTFRVIMPRQYAVGERQ